MADRVEVHVDQDLCVSAGRCMSDIPEAFDFDDDELAEVLPGASAVSIERLQAAARNCPGQAITIRLVEAG